MIRFRSMGCEISASDAAAEAARELFSARDRKFSRFVESSELNRVNVLPRGAMLVSEEFATMLEIGLEAARATGGLVTPAVGAAVIAAGYDRDFDDLPDDGAPVAPTRVPPLDGLSLRGRLLARSAELVLDLNGVVKGCTADDAVAAAGGGWVCAGGDTATTVPLTVGLPLGGAVTLESGGLATSSIAVRRWRRGGEPQHHLIDPRTGLPARSPWWDVSVVAASCLIADVAAKAGLLLGAAGPAWLDARGLAGRFVDGSGGVHANETWQSALDERLAA